MPPSPSSVSSRYRPTGRPTGAQRPRNACLRHRRKHTADLETCRPRYLWSPDDFGGNRRERRQSEGRPADRRLRRSSPCSLVVAMTISITIGRRRGACAPDRRHLRRAGRLVLRRDVRPDQSGEFVDIDGADRLARRSCGSQDGRLTGDAHVRRRGSGGVELAGRRGPGREPRLIGHGRRAAVRAAAFAEELPEPGRRRRSHEEALAPRRRSRG